MKGRPIYVSKKRRKCLHLLWINLLYTAKSQMYIGNSQFNYFYRNTRTRTHVCKLMIFYKKGMYITREYDMITLKNRKQGDLQI